MLNISCLDERGSSRRFSAQIHQEKRIERVSLPMSHCMALVHLTIAVLGALNKDPSSGGRLVAAEGDGPLGRISLGPGSVVRLRQRPILRRGLQQKEKKGTKEEITTSFRQTSKDRLSKHGTHGKQGLFIRQTKQKNRHHQPSRGLQLRTPGPPWPWLVITRPGEAHQAIGQSDDLHALSQRPAYGPTRLGLSHGRLIGRVRSLPLGNQVQRCS